jgi:chromate transporter
LNSINLWALVLSVAAIVAIFRLKIGMIPTLIGCCSAGLLLYFVGALS